MLETILAISGKPGLYKLISRGNRSLIVETLDEAKKRISLTMKKPKSRPATGGNKNV